jgi:branched-chain amino acid transport system substrate-binding protein
MRATAAAYATLFLLFLSAVYSGVASAENTAIVRIGVVLSLSGPGAVFGIPERDAIVALANKLNADRGEKPRIDLVIQDDKTNPTEAARVVNQIINNDKVVAIIGPGTGGNILASAPIAQKHEVPLLGPAGTLAITDKKNSFYPWVFRLTASDRIGIKVILEDMAKSGVKRIGVFHQEDAYGKTGVDLAHEICPTLGLELVEAVSAPYSATDLTAQATKLRNSKVEAVLLQINLPVLGSSFMKASREVGLSVPTYANAGLAQRSFAETVGPEAQGLRVLSVGNLPFDPSPPEKELAIILEAAGKTPQGWAELVGSNGFMTVLNAVDAVGKSNVTGAQLRDAIENSCGFKTYSRGKPCFSKDNHDGWAEDALAVTELKGKQLITRP